jgi:hypothetical protein
VLRFFRFANRGTAIYRFILIAACILLAISFWKRDDLPSGKAVHPALADEPEQRKTSRSAFTTRWKDVEYRVDPEFEYELRGLVVSFRRHDGNSRMHRRANDHLNVADVCVLWSDNASSQYLDEFRFWNGIFTCNVKTSSSAAWESFDITAMSNNHLISDDPDIRARVNGIRIGDQVRIRGVLASYGAVGGSSRGTSTTREDTGDGACETIFVDSFEIIEAAAGHWRYSMYFSLVLVAIMLGGHFRRPYRPHAASGTS